MQRVQKKIAKRLPGRQLTLDDYVMTASTLPVPPFVEMCVHFVELEGLTMEGVYRTSGNKGAVDQFMEKYLDSELFRFIFYICWLLIEWMFLNTKLALLMTKWK
jgi:hypothetical protein